jgi:hypothetical protein
MVSTSEWNRFFVGAGIPRSIAAQYAVTFNENRINFDMLMDLNKVTYSHISIDVVAIRIKLIFINSICVFFRNISKIWALQCLEMSSPF